MKFKKRSYRHLSIGIKKITLFFILSSVIFLRSSVLFSQENESNPPVDSDFLLPKELNLCGEPVPLDDQWVWEMLDRELTISAWNKAQVFMWLKRAGRYFPYLEESLAREDMPQDIKYLVIAESGLLPRVKSGKGAVGFWQFMPDTAIHNGLRSDKQIDERCDFEQSTAAALKYLQKLKKMFGTWTLSMAAYNCGEQRVLDAIKEQRQTYFYSLKLPDETERYIYQITAAKMIMENPAAYGYHVPDEKIYKPVQCDTTWVDVEKKIHITDFAEALGTSLMAIRNLNPQIIDNYLPIGLYTLRTPPGAGANVPKVLESISPESNVEISDNSSTRTYIVKKGDTLGEISQQTGVAVSKLIKINNLKGSVVREGQVLSLE
jgi:membrane-bound lytic murein transglycosylase D